MAETAAPKKPLRFRNYRPADATLAPGAAPPATAQIPAKSTGASVPTGSDANGGKKGAAQPAPPQQAQEEAKGGEGQQAQAAAGQQRTGKAEEENVIKRELQKHLEAHGSEQLNVAPRKQNWDLKRDVAKKMERLNRLTQKAVVELLREKLAREAEEGSSGSEEEEDGDEEED